MRWIELKPSTRKYIKVLIATTVVFTALIVSFAIYAVRTGKVENITVQIDSLKDRFVSSLSEGITPKLPMNILLLGVDGKNNGRTDTIMLVHVDKDKTPIIISIPRDTRVKLDGKSGYYKINSAYVYGGIDLSIKTIEELLGINIDRYVVVNYEAVRKLVDMVGGVDVDVPFHLYYVDTTPGKELYIDIPAGQQHLNGHEAVEFLRWRHNSDGREYGPGGDLGRIEMQRRLLRALLDKFKKPEYLAKLPVIIATVSKYTKHDFVYDELLWFAKNAESFNVSNIEAVTLPGYPKWINGVSYYIVNVNEIKKFVSLKFRLSEAIR